MWYLGQAVTRALQSCQDGLWLRVAGQGPPLPPSSGASPAPPDPTGRRGLWRWWELWGPCVPIKHKLSSPFGAHFLELGGKASGHLAGKRIHILCVSTTGHGRKGAGPGDPEPTLPARGPGRGGVCETPRVRVCLIVLALGDWA